MINLVTTMSRYLMILLILIYTYYNFRFFSLPDDESKLRLCRLQNVPLFLIFLLSGTIIIYKPRMRQLCCFSWRAACLFCPVPALIPAVLPECVETVAEQHVYASVHQFYHADAHLDGQGGPPVYHHGSCGGYHNDYTICDR